MTRKNMQKKIMCILLSLAMMLTLIPGTALAEDGQQEQEYRLMFSDEANLPTGDMQQVRRKISSSIELKTFSDFTMEKYMYIAGYQGNELVSLIPATDVTFKPVYEKKENGSSQVVDAEDIKVENVDGTTNQVRISYKKSADVFDIGAGKQQAYQIEVTKDGMTIASAAVIMPFGLTLQTNKYVAYSDSGSLANGFFYTPITVAVDGLQVKDYMITPDETVGTLGTITKDADNGTFTFAPKQAGNFSFSITCNGKEYRFEFYIDPQDLNQGGQDEPQEVAPVDENVNYDIVSEALLDPSEYEIDRDAMLVNGQETSLPFNSHITKWYTCFFVRNRVTRYDARFVPIAETQKIRTYIGGENDFVIKARLKETNDVWIEQSNLAEDLRIFKMSYMETYKGYENVYKIEYATTDMNKVIAADDYEYHLFYTGGDEYLNNAQKASNGFEINLQYYPEEEIDDFDIDEEYEDEEGQWAIGNEHHFNTVGTTLKMKKIIRPSVLKCVMDKTLYQKVYNKREDNIIYIEDEAENIKFCRKGDDGTDVEMTPEESPFSIEWDDANQYYVVTYEKPEKDIYGPEYSLKYVGDYAAKINAHYQYSPSRVGNCSDLVTGKLTVRPSAGDVVNDTIDASTDNERINTTEVIFGRDVLEQLNRELKIKTKHGDISFEGDIVKNLKDSQSNDASFEMRDVKTDNYGLTNEQKNALHNCDVAFDFDIASGEAKVEFGENGSAAIVIPFTDMNKAVYYLDEDGKVHPVEYFFEKGHVKFIAKHFSTYVVAEKGLKDGESLENPGTSGGTGGSAAPSDQITQSGAATTVGLSGSTVSKGGETTTIIAQTTADKLVETAVKNNSEEIIVDAVTKNPSAADSTKSAEVILSGDTLKDIAEKTEADVVIRTNVAEVRLDTATVKAAASQAAPGETVSIVAEKVKEAAKEIHFELKIVTGSGKVISDFQGGKVAVTVSVPKSLRGKKLTCVYIDENGYMHRVEGAMNADGTFTFTTGHFSQYALMDEEDAESAIQAQKAEVEAVKLTLSSRLVKMKSGKKAIKLTWKGGEDIHLDGIEIYRSTKKSTGYGKKPLFTTTKTAYYNTAARAGKRYYYKVRGFVTVDGEKVYTRYSTKAWRTVK